MDIMDIMYDTLNQNIKFKYTNIYNLYIYINYIC